MEMLFRDAPDLEGCLEALQEAIDERPQWVGANLDALAKQIKSRLAYLGDFVIADLNGQSDFAAWKNRLNSDTFAVAHLEALFYLAEVRERLTRPAWLPAARPWQRITGTEAVDILRPAFEAVLEQQGRARLYELEYKTDAMQAARRKGGRRAPAATLRGIIYCLLQENPDARAKDLWEILQVGRTFPRVGGGEIIVTADSNGDDLSFVRDPVAGTNYPFTFKVLQTHLTEVRKQARAAKNRDK
jgi:hypothetical protein